MLLLLHVAVFVTEASDFFATHSFINSSLYLMYSADTEAGGVWMIDFNACSPAPAGVRLDHRSAWEPGNHEDGYLFGLDNLIRIWKDLEVTHRSGSATL